jgi:hypothetical protein
MKKIATATLLGAMFLSLSFVGLSSFTSHGDDSPPGEIKFTAVNDKMTANGTFDSWRITKFEMANGIESAAIAIEVDLSSINTGMADLDGDLQSGDFFNVAKFPKCTATTGKITKSETGYSTTMTLEMNGMKAEANCNFKVVSEKPLKVEGKIDYNRNMNKIGDTSKGAFYGLLPEVTVEFTATLN